LNCFQKSCTNLGCPGEVWMGMLWKEQHGPQPLWSLRIGKLHLGESSFERVVRGAPATTSTGFSSSQATGKAPSRSQFTSVAQSCLTLCDPMDCRTPGFPVHHQLLELAQTHVHWVGDAIQPFHPLSSPSPPAFNLSSIRVFSIESVLRIRWPKYRSFSFSICPSNEYSGLIFFRIDRFDLLAVQGTLKSLLQGHSSKASILQCSVFFMVQLSHPYMLLLLLLSHFSRVRLCATRRRQPTRLPHPWDSPGKNTGVGCHFLLQCMKVKSQSEVAQSCPTLSDLMDCSLPGSSVHGIFQARVLERAAIAFSDPYMTTGKIIALTIWTALTSLLRKYQNICWTTIDQKTAGTYQKRKLTSKKNDEEPQDGCFCCSVAQSCPILCNSMDCSMPGFSILHHLLEFNQTHVHERRQWQPTPVFLPGESQG